MAAPDASEFQWPPILAACEVHLAKTGEHVLGAMCEDDPLSAELVEVRLQSPAVGVVTHLLLEEVGPADEEVDARAASRGVSVHWVSPEYPPPHPDGRLFGSATPGPEPTLEPAAPPPKRRARRAPEHQAQSGLDNKEEFVLSLALLNAETHGALSPDFRFDPGGRGAGRARRRRETRCCGRLRSSRTGRQRWPAPG